MKATICKIILLLTSQINFGSCNIFDTDENVNLLTIKEILTFFINSVVLDIRLNFLFPKFFITIADNGHGKKPTG